VSTASGHGTFAEGRRRYNKQKGKKNPEKPTTMRAPRKGRSEDDVDRKRERDENPKPKNKVEGCGTKQRFLSPLCLDIP
jgi:hypothetical protein